MIINLKEDDSVNNIKTIESGYAVLVNTENGEKYFTRFLKTDDHEDVRKLIDIDSAVITSDEDVSEIVYV